MKITPTLLALGAVLFLLPFAEISCQGRRLNMTGIQLVTGRQIDGQKTPTSSVAALVLVVAVSAAAFGFMQHEQPEKFFMATSGVVTSLLIILPSTLASTVERESNGLGSVSMKAGYYLALATFGAATALNVWRWRRSQPNHSSP